MHNWLSTATVLGSLLGAVWSLISALRGVRPSGPLLGTVAFVWVLLLVQGVMATIAQFRVNDPPDPFLFLGYHLTAIVVLPLGVAWGIADRSRWGNGVLAIACFSEAVLVIRMLQIWATRG